MMKKIEPDKDEKLETKIFPTQNILTALNNTSSSLSLVSPENFYTVDFSDNEEIKSENVRIVISDKHIYDHRFHRFKKIKKLFLCVHASKSDIYSDSVIFTAKKLIQSIYKWNILIYLHLELEINTRNYFHTEEVEDFFNQISSTYSSLENASFCSKIIDKKDFNVVINSTKKNNLIRKLARDLSTKIKSLRLEGSLGEIAKLIQLAKFHGEFWLLRLDNYIDIATFFSLLDSDITDEEKNVFKNAEEYHLFNAIKNRDFIFVKKNILPSYTEEERNAIFYANAKPMRVMDNVTDTEILIKLINHYKFNPFSLEQADYKISPTQVGALKNILFSHEITLESFIRINEYEDIILDALSLLIDKYNNEEDLFFEYYFQGNTIIEPNQVIRYGIYKGYTLIQIYCLRYNKLHNDNPNAKIKKIFFECIAFLPEHDKRIILNSTFPKRGDNNNQLTVLQYLVLHHMSPLLFNFLAPDSVITESSGYQLYITNETNNSWFGFNLLTLFFRGLVDKQTEYLFSHENSFLVYQWLMKNEHKPLWHNQNALTQLTIPSEYAGKTFQLPIIHYLFLKIVLVHDSNLFTKIFNDFFSIDTQTESFQGYKNLTALQFFILFADKEYPKFFTEALIGWLSQNDNTKKIAYKILSEFIPRYNNPPTLETLFQMTIKRANFLASFIQQCSQHLKLDLLANQPFPADAEHGGWTPIQYVLHRIKRGKFPPALFNVLLGITGVDLNVFYPTDSYLKGLTLLQAMALHSDFDPDKRQSRNPDQSFLEDEPLQDMAKDFIDKLSYRQINETCREKRSSYFGMTALHIAVMGQNTNIIGILLSNENTDYTKMDAKGKTVWEYAKFMKDSDMDRLLDGVTSKFPHHIMNFQQGFKFQSEVNPNFSVTLEDWVVSIVRERNSEHVFLAIEGIEIDQAKQRIRHIMKLAHLIAPTFYGKGRIKTVQEPSEESDGWFQFGPKTNFVLYKLANKTPGIMLKPGMQFFPESDNVSPEKCIAIWNEIKAEEKAGKTYYSALGRRGFFGLSTSSNHGNCVDWARLKYNKLVKPSSQLTATWDMYFVTLARGFLNHRFNFVIREESDYLDAQVFQTSALMKTLWHKQNAIINRQNKFYSITIAMLTYLLIRESHIENGYMSNFYLSLLLAISLGGLFFKVEQTFFSPNESLVDEEVSNQKFSLSN